MSRRIGGVDIAIVWDTMHLNGGRCKDDPEPPDGPATQSAGPPSVAEPRCADTGSQPKRNSENRAPARVGPPREKSGPNRKRPR